jgi:hypothetical protein
MHRTTFWLSVLLLGTTACSLLPWKSSAGPATSAAAPETLDPREALCARTIDKAGPKPGPNLGDNPARRRKRWRPVLQAATREQFVTAKVDIQMSTQYDNRYWIRRTIPAGEPLLLLSCYSKKSMEVLSIDGMYEDDVDLDKLDLEPAIFSWKTLPPLEVKGAMNVINESHPDDKATIPGLAALQQKYDDCSMKATGACMAAEKQVKEGPPRADLDAATAAACDKAVGQALKGCMGDADKQRLYAAADKLKELTAARDAKFDQDMHAKLAK